MSALPVWIEVHVDDFVLAQDPARWPDAAALLDRMARLAESAGARLSFRVMETFARGDRGGFLTGLVGRGHEVGWHTHGKRLPEAVEALAGAGVDDAAAIGAPGLVQVGARGRDKLLREAQALGLRVLTDRLEERYHAYQGWLAWEVLPGVASLDVSVSPFSWGVLHKRGRAVTHGHGTLDWDALTRQLRVREREEPPPGEAAFFGATFHEHNLCREGSLDADPRALDAFARALGALGERVVPAASVLRGTRWESHQPDPPLDARQPGAGHRARRLWQKVRGRLEHAPFVAARREGTDGQDHPLVLDVGQARARHELPAWREDFFLRVAGRQVQVRRVGLASARAIVVAAHGGESGIQQGLSFLGLSEDALAAHDVVLYLFARSEGARTPGNPQHVADTRAVIEHALSEGPPVGLLTWSAGVVPALRAVVEGGLRARFLVDCEGPCDRFSVVPPLKPEHELASADPFDEAPWAGREAIRHVGDFPGAYLRVQAGLDHVHGPMVVHARRMVAAARDGRLNEAGEILPGHLWEHGARVFGWIGQLVARVAG